MPANQAQEVDDRPVNRSELAAHPEWILAAGFGLGIVALFLPWWAFSPAGQPFGLVGGVGITGLSGWGIGYFIVWLVGTTLLLLRTVARDAVLDFDPPVADWFVFGACGVLMAIFALTTLDWLFFGGVGQMGLRYGWWLAMISAILVVVGALLMRQPESE
jgi:hypothetical protein